MNRREFMKIAGLYTGATALSGCTDAPPAERYNQADRDLLASQRREEQAASGKGPFGSQVYKGYRGLAELPWFDLDSAGRLHCPDDSIPPAIGL